MTAAGGQIEFYFDLSSPWTYLGFTNVQRVAERTGATILWRPILVGAVFNAVNKFLYELRALPADSPRMRQTWKSLDDWAAYTGIAIKFPPKAHPARSVHAMRMCSALEYDQPALQRFAKAAFEAYFGRDENLDDPDVLVAAANGAGLDGAAIRERASAARSSAASFSASRASWNGPLSKVFVLRGAFSFFTAA